MKLKNKIFKMTLKNTKAAKAARAKARREERDASRIMAARLLIKTVLNIDVEIVATARDFYIVGEYPAKLEKQLDKLLVKSLNGTSIDTQELPENVSLKAALKELKGA